jgi:acetyl esterase/lipase
MVWLRRLVATYGPVDFVDGESPSVTFSALIYAAYLDGKGSPALEGRQGLDPAPDLFGLVNDHAPPAFLVHAADDPSVPVGNSVRMYSALKAAGVGAELHVFPEGGHGFGIGRAGDKPVKVWPELFLAWLRALPQDHREPEYVR